MQDIEIKDEVKKYYGQTLEGSQDLKTNACCTVSAYPKHITEVMAKIHDDVMSRYYGCGLTIPTNLENLNVLDLGSGSGRDVYLLSSLVGEKGRVIGVDMTDEQLDIARKHLDYHAQAFNHPKSNVSFLKGEIEKLDQLDIPSESLDLVISNCVINLSTDKLAVLKGVNKLLKEGGEFYFSDVYSDRRIPMELQKDPVLYGECLSGALYWNDFLTLAKQAGFADPRSVEFAPITIENKEIQEKVGPIKFYSVTYRLFKIEELEADCEDYGQAVIYKGTIPESPHQFVLDDHHIIKKGKVFNVCGNSYRMLHQSRLKEHFQFIGDFQTHHGIFEGCGASCPFELNDQDSSPVTNEKGSCC